MPNDSKRLKWGSNEIPSDSKRFHRNFKRFQGVPRGTERIQEVPSGCKEVPRDSKRLHGVSRDYKSVEEGNRWFKDAPRGF